MLEDAYPNFSICGIPYYVSGEVPDWRNLAHRTVADLEATGMTLRLDTVARRIDVDRHELVVTDAGGAEEAVGYDKLDRRHRGAPCATAESRGSTAPILWAPTTACICSIRWVTPSRSCARSSSNRPGAR